MGRDPEYMHHVVRLAREAQQAGNLPIGGVVSLNGKVVAGGRNSIWVPEFNLSKHAEFEALKAVPTELWARSKEMTLYYTTLEPCLMCIGAILLYRIGRAVFGSSGSRGGASCVFSHLPPSFEAELQALEWVGPVLPQECDELYETTLTLLAEHRSRF
jgi:tRNA(adenine34) deaminase